MTLIKPITGQDRVIGLLIKYCADVNSIDIEGFTPLIFAAQRGKCRLFFCE